MKLKYLIIALIGLGLLGAIVYKSQSPTKISDLTKIFECNIQMPFSSNIFSKPSGRGTMVSSEIQPLNVKKILIKAGFDLNRSSQNPLYELRIAKGHYLFKPYTNDRLIYDGKEVFNKRGLANIVLSKNGLHYAYQVNKLTTHIPIQSDIYIDGSLVKSGNYLWLLGLADNGKDYFYTAETNKITVTSYNTAGINEEILYKADKEIYRTPLGLMGLQVSSDGCHFFSVRRSDSGLILVYDGKDVTHADFDLSYGFKLSDNGKHYSYLLPPYPPDSKLIIDGEVKHSSKKGYLYLSQLTNSGDYAFIDDKRVYINNKPLSLYGKLIYFNQNLDHFLIYKGDGIWLLDGKNLNLDSPVNDADFDNDTLYIYSVIP